MSAGAKARRLHMSHGRTPGSMCLGKDRYHTQSAADRVIATLPGFARAYRCPLCKHLHITSKPLRGRS